MKKKCLPGLKQNERNQLYEHLVFCFVYCFIKLSAGIWRQFTAAPAAQNILAEQSNPWKINQTTGATRIYTKTGIAFASSAFSCSLSHSDSDKGSPRWKCDNDVTDFSASESDIPDNRLGTLERDMRARRQQPLAALLHVRQHSNNRGWSGRDGNNRCATIHFPSFLRCSTLCAGGLRQIFSGEAIMKLLTVYYIDLKLREKSLPPRRSGSSPEFPIAKTPPPPKTRLSRDLFLSNCRMFFNRKTVLSCGTLPDRRGERA